MASNYSIIVDAELDLTKIKEQLDKISNQGINLNVHGASQGARDVNNLRDSTENLNLTYQQFRETLNSVVTVMSSMYEQVRTLDSAITEYSKVTELSGSALDDYVDKLSQLGQEVGRTGKPNRSEPVCTNGKCA